MDEEANCTFSKRGNQYFLTWIMHDATLPKRFRILYSPCFETKDGVAWQLSLWTGRDCLFCTLTRKVDKGPSRVLYSVHSNIFIGHQRPEHALYKRQTPTDKIFRKGMSAHFCLLPESHARNVVERFPPNAPPKVILQICLQRKQHKNFITKSLSVVSELPVFTFHKLVHECVLNEPVSGERDNSGLSITLKLNKLYLCRLYLLDVNGHIRSSSEPRMFEPGEHHIHTFKEEDIVTCNFSRHGEVSFLLELSWHKYLQHVDRKWTFCDRSQKKNMNLRNDMKHLFQNRPAVTNFEIRSGVDVLKVHKGVIGARSCVFHSMLSHNMTEKLSKVINIEDIDTKTLENFFGYLYSGTFKYCMEWMDVCYLYAAANKYCVQSLLNVCKTQLISCISFENHEVLLAFSYRFGDKDLESGVNFFKRLHSGKFICSDGCYSKIDIKEIGYIVKRLRAE